MGSIWTASTKQGSLMGACSPTILRPIWIGLQLLVQSLPPPLLAMEVPSRPLSVIDFHGLGDRTIPYSLPTSEGSGPDDTIISFDGYFYYDKPRVISSWAEAFDCDPAQEWPTYMDGVKNFTCVIHTGCMDGGEIVHCHARYGHDYPFGPDRYIESSRIMWDFMKAHPKQSSKTTE